MPSIPKIPPELTALLTLGSTLVVWVGGGTLLGHWAGTSWGFEPWGTLSGSLLGIAGAGYTVYKVVRRLDAENAPKTRNETDTAQSSVNGKPSKTPSKPPS